MAEEPLGLFVERKRFRLGVSQRELAERCGLHHSTIARIEQGWYETISNRTLQKLSVGLEIPIAFLVQLKPGRGRVKSKPVSRPKYSQYGT